MKSLKGLLCPIFSLPNNEGIGTLGKEAFSFIDMLKKHNLNAWQILPINPISFGNSPYQSFSSFAIEELFIDLDYFLKEKLITKIKAYRGPKKKVDYNKVREYKTEIFEEAFQNYLKKYGTENLLRFGQKYHRINEYCIFQALKDRNKQGSFPYWIFKNMDQRYYARYYYHLFLQKVALYQYNLLKAYANKNGIKIIGDLPFYVSGDSSDVYFNRDYFLLNKNGEPRFIAGVGPDYFSEDGQRWGNPIYNYTNLKMDDYSFLMERIAYANELYDYVRIDHFRAFESYYVIDAKEETARNGTWKKGIGSPFFVQLFKRFPKIKIIAEDLGDNMEEAYKLRDEFELPGMNILEFNLFDILNKKSRYKADTITYIGTHDNSTLKGWWKTLSKEGQDFLIHKLNSSRKNILLDINKYLFTYKHALLSITDLLYLDDEHRINHPSTINDDNWTLRVDSLEKMDENLKEILDD